MPALIGSFAILVVAGATPSGFCVPGKVEGQFKQPIGVAVDLKGNVFIADSEANVVKKCTPAGQCQNFSSGWDWPTGIAVGVDDTVYVSAGDDHAPVVKKCTPAGQCSQFGDHAWNSPRGVAVGQSLENPSDAVWIANAYGKNYGVWQCTSSGLCALVGDSKSWPHYPPECIAVDSLKSVYVTGGDEDEGNSNYVKKCDSNGRCSDFSGKWSKGGGFNDPVAVDSDDNIYLGDSSAHVLKKCTPTGTCADLKLPGFEGGRDMAIAANGALYVSNGASVTRFCLPSGAVVV